MVDKHDEKPAEHKQVETLTPTPTQEENDRARGGSGKRDPELDKRAAKADEHEPPTMTQAENDAAMLAATGGEPPTPPPIDPPPVEGGASHKHAEAAHGAAYQTRTVKPK